MISQGYLFNDNKEFVKLGILTVRVGLSISLKVQKMSILEQPL